MPKRPDKVKKQLTPGRPKSAVSESYGTLPKQIMGSHMGYVQTGGGQTAPIVKGPAIGRPPKQPPRPRQAPPK